MARIVAVVVFVVPSSFTPAHRRVATYAIIGPVALAARQIGRSTMQSDINGRSRDPQASRSPLRGSKASARGERL